MIATEYQKSLIYILFKVAKHAQDQQIIRFTMQLWPYMTSAGSDLFYTGPRPSILLSLICKYVKLSFHSTRQKTNFLIKRQEINRHEKGNEKLCGKELHI